ncbi:MAG: hypothetical protein ACD_62C00248G0002 [uncultured bacterium]|nr:MAG: hypothetical protein ACD_62C00248G0002 [uncultured bacterium]
MNMIKLEILSPQQVIAKEVAVSQIVIPAHWGQMCILPGHTAFTTLLTKGLVRYQAGQQTHEHNIEGGFFVIKNNTASILIV